MTLLSEKLKLQTRQSHMNIESCEAFKRLMSPNLTYEEYTLILACWRKFHQNCENAITTNPKWRTLLEDYEHRKKLNLLDNDLLVLGINIDMITLEAPALIYEDEPSFWGYYYVTEGSSLGAQVITKKLRSHAFIDSGSLTYYSGYENQTMKMWEVFKSQLNSWGEENQDLHEAVVTFANTTFESLYKNMNQNFTQHNLNTIKKQLC